MSQREPLFQVQDARDETLNRSFRAVLQSAAHQGTRSLIEQAWAELPDPDPNFVSEFRGAGFDARIWELYLYRVFTEQSFIVTQEEGGLDFVVRGRRCAFHVEASVARPAEHNEASWPPDMGLVEMQTRWALKLGSRVHSKRRELRKKKKSLPEGAQVVFAIAPFFGLRGHSLSAASLLPVLYGVGFDHADVGKPLSEIRTIPAEHLEIGGKSIKGAMFQQSGMESVSAVLFSNTGTVAKFHRMHQQHEPTAGYRVFRQGSAHNHAREASEPRPFSYEVGVGHHRESWSEGLTIFHNPWALKPLPRPLLRHAADVRLQPDRQVHSLIPRFHPYMSSTVTMPAGRTPTQDELLWLQHAALAKEEHD